MALAVDVYDITCINKQPRNDPHHRVTHVGGWRPTTGRWRMAEDEAIQAIRRGSRFTATGGGRTVEVEVAHHEGRPYLRTRPDGTTLDNLLSLPECPLY
jgi:hypothetical protein